MNNFHLSYKLVLIIFSLFPIGAFAAAVEIPFEVQLKAQPNVGSSIVFKKLNKQNNSNIYYLPFRPSSLKTRKAFEQLEGFKIGLNKGFEYSIRDYTDPFWIGRGTASGDYNNDGWQDIVFGSNQGFMLYKNIGGRFELQQQPNAEINEYMVYAVALVDLNNDSWLDIFFTTFNKGNFLVLNKNGIFDFQNLISVPNQNAVLTLSPAFGDLDQNGQLDILNGNIALGVVTGMNHVQARRNNSVTFNDHLQFRDVLMENTSGETMATLISDINNDDIPDVYMGNDFIVPDKILLGTGNGYVQSSGNKLIPFTPFFSMGADTGDVNNDLTLDFVITGTMYMAAFVGKQSIDGKSVVEYSEFKGAANTCNAIHDERFQKSCLKIRNSNYIEELDANHYSNFSECQAIKEPIGKQICATELMWKLITSNEKPENCEAQFAGDERLYEVCEILKLRGKRYDKRDLYGAIPQDDRNMLYTFNSESKTFSPVNEFKHPGGWTWNSKIVDLDNDGWQDVITSDGTVRKNGYGWNVLMKNIDGKHFEQQQFTAGIAADFGLYSFVLIDMDNDGDLDIIGNSAEGPVQIYRNHSTDKNHSIAISLNDHVGNYYGIGAKIIIYYNNREKSQIREIKASGGYMSFDPAIAYFGLKDNTIVDEINVLWPDRTKSVYVGPFKSDQHYRIERVANEKQ